MQGFTRRPCADLLQMGACCSRPGAVLDGQDGYGIHKPQAAGYPRPAVAGYPPSPVAGYPPPYGVPAAPYPAGEPWGCAV